MHLDMRKYAFQPAEQRERILEDVLPKIKGMKILRNRILVATYTTPEKTAGGIIRPDRNLDESRYQGKVGLVLKLGPFAGYFNDDPLPSHVPTVGDWIFYRASDTWECAVAPGVSCRVIFDDCVMGILEDPESIY